MHHGDISGTVETLGDVVPAVPGSNRTGQPFTGDASVLKTPSAARNVPATLSPAAQQLPTEGSHPQLRLTGGGSVETPPTATTPPAPGTGDGRVEMPLAASVFTAYGQGEAAMRTLIEKHTSPPEYRARPLPDAAIVEGAGHVAIKMEQSPDSSSALEEYKKLGEQAFDEDELTRYELLRPL